MRNALQQRHIVLVVDDDLELARQITKMLSRQGLEALSVADVEQAEQRLRAGRVGLVVTDLHMPGRDGFSLLSSIRTNPTTQHLPVVMLSGDSERESIRTGHISGIDTYLTKPVDPDELITTCLRLISRRQDSEERIERFRASVMAAIPHELRTPLNGIMGLASLLAEAPESFSESRTQLAEIGKALLTSAQRLDRLVDSFVLYAQFEADQHLDPGLHPGEASDPIRACREATERTAESNRRRDDLIWRGTGSRSPAGAELIAVIKKCAEELVDNACKFSDAGTPITVTMERDDGRTVFTVRDTGRGMTREQIASVGPFVQFDREIYEQQGSGLGLSICRKLAGQVDGSLELKPGTDAGLIAQITLPEA